MFEKASRLKLRFKVANGVVSTEDLWNLSLERLDDLARSLNKEIQDREVSFIKKETQAESALALSFEIVKHIIAERLAEQEAAKSEAEKRLRRKAILEALADRDEADLKAKSKEDLLKELEALDK